MPTKQKQQKYFEIYIIFRNATINIWIKIQIPIVLTFELQ